MGSDRQVIELTSGTVTVRTGTQGAAARAGHRLELVFPDWSGEVHLVDRRPQAVGLRVGLASLTVVSGFGGVTPLTPVDKQLIRRNAAKTLGLDRFPEVTFASTRIAGNEVSGELTIHGMTRSINALIDIADGRAIASVPVRQTDFGVKPYSLAFGQLKVADEVIVELDIEIPEGLNG